MGLIPSTTSERAARLTWKGVNMQVWCDRRHCNKPAVLHVRDEETFWCDQHLPEKDKGRKLADKETSVVLRNPVGFRYA